MRFLTLTLSLMLLAPLVHGADSDSIESITKALYDTISGPAGTRDWDRFRSLFADGGRLVTMVNGKSTVFTVDEYIKRAGGNMSRGGFFESEVARRVESFGKMAHVFSTFESRTEPKAQPFERGINSFQLVKEASGWKVLTILWDNEHSSGVLPEKYLKN